METLDRYGGLVGEVGRGDRVVRGCNNGGVVGVRQGCAWGGQKNGGLLINKQGQRRDVRAQRHDVLKGEIDNVATLRSNATT